MHSIYVVTFQYYALALDCPLLMFQISACATVILSPTATTNDAHADLDIPRHQEGSVNMFYSTNWSRLISLTNLQVPWQNTHERRYQDPF